MKSSQNIQQGFKNIKLPAIKKLWHYYPSIMLSLVLVIIFIYFIIVQILNYNEDVQKIKKEFPEDQRKELILKILTIKDYILWVKANPEPNINMYLQRKFSASQNVLDFYIKSDSVSANSLSLIIDSLNSLNKSCFCKIVLLDKKLTPFQIPSFMLNGTYTGISKNLNSFRFVSYNSNDTITQNYFDSNSKLLMLYKPAIQPKYNIGFLIGEFQKDDILKEIILDSLCKIKYLNDEYIFINTFDGSALLARGSRQIYGNKIRMSLESNWLQVFEKEVEFAQVAGGGFYTYYWRNTPNQPRKEKTSYFAGELGWKWIIGTGFFSSDIQPVLDKMRKDLWREIVTTIFTFFAFLLLMTAVIYLFTRRYASRTDKNIELFLNFFKRASHGLQVIDKSKIEFEEFSILADAANHMISEREKIKTVLATEKSKLRHMIDAIPDLIFFKNTNSLFEGCNTAFEKYVGKKSSELIGLSEFELFGKTQADSYIKSDKRIFETLVPERSAEWVIMRNGERCLFDTLKTPYFDSDKNLLGIIGISRDITEMEETRQRLILAKEKAEESDRLKTAFLANMSHEIRTPMNAIIGFSDLLSDDELSNDDKVDFISKIKTAGNSLMTLINDIIDIAKIEAGQLKISESELNLHKLLKEIQSTYTNLKNLNGKENINLDLILSEPDKEMWIYTDHFRLQQVLNNLLNNALKFTEFGSVEFGYILESDLIEFFVKDTGIGILRSKQKLLFKRFSQIDAGANRKYGGTGLGLAISSNLVELLGGSMSVESFPGKGSTFTFTIPFKPATRKIPTEFKKSQKQVDWNGKTILIAEDSMQNYLLVEAVLRFSKARLIHATDGQKAIDIVKSRKDIDLILMDIQLPVKTGYEALKEIQDLSPNIPILSYTAFALPNEREKSLNAGFFDYIPKPIKSETLIPILDKYLSASGLDSK